MRIVVAAAHRVFASALGSLLRQSGHHVVGYAIAFGAAADLVARVQADACVLDADMLCEPGAIGTVMEAAPGIALVVLADATDSAGLSLALSEGAHGAALKSDDSAEFLRVLTGACAQTGRRAPGDTVLSLSAQAARRTVLGGQRRPDLARSLTPREREVLARLVRGESTSAMARSMGVRLSTTRSHIDSLLIKLGAHSRLEAIAFAVKEGIVDVAAGVSDMDWDEPRALSG
jgi:two-component system, NarL family, nitrate/nitrite response regulator NarL